MPQLQRVCVRWWLARLAKHFVSCFTTKSPVIPVSRSKKIRRGFNPPTFHDLAMVVLKFTNCWICTDLAHRTADTNFQQRPQLFGNGAGICANIHGHYFCKTTNEATRCLFAFQSLHGTTVNHKKSQQGKITCAAAKGKENISVLSHQASSQCFETFSSFCIFSFGSLPLMTNVPNCSAKKFVI